MTTTTCDSIHTIRRLLQYIQEERLRPGDQLPPIRNLARAWRANASVVRSGLLKAEAMGVVEIRPRAGAFVAEFRFERILDIVSVVFEAALQHREHRLLHLYDTRAILETEAFRRAAEQAGEEDIFELTRAFDRLCRTGSRAEEIEADEEFHLLVARIGGNPVVVAVLDVLLALMRPDRLLIALTAMERTQSRARHRELLDTIRRKDSARAAKLAAAHNESRKQGLIRAADRMARLPRSRSGGKTR